MSETTRARRYYIGFVRSGGTWNSLRGGRLYSKPEDLRDDVDQHFPLLDTFVDLVVSEVVLPE